MSGDASFSEPQLEQDTSEHVIPSQLSRANVCGLSRKVSTEPKTNKMEQEPGKGR